MSQDQNDLLAIRKIIQSELIISLRSNSREELVPVTDFMKLTRRDIKEIYDMLAEQQKGITGSSKFQKLDLEKKILKIHSELVAAAKQAVVTLPR